MTSKEAITKLNVLSSYDTTKEKRDEYKECIYAIQKDLETLEIINSKRFLLFSKRKKLAKEYEDWCIKNNVLITDTTNMVTWLLCIKLKEWLENEK